MSFESIVDQVESLPPMPESILKIQELFARGTMDINVLVKMIEEDPILTSEILAKANAPIYSFSRQIVSVSQAVTLFGAVMIRGLLLAFAASENIEFTMEPYGISNAQFKELSSLQSALMFQWYMGVDIDKARTLIPIAFLMNMGKVVIAREIAGSDYADEFRKAIAHSDNVKEVESLFTGMTSAKINALLFEKWHFEEIFIKTMEHVDDIGNVPPEYLAFVQALRVVERAINIRAFLTDESIEAAGELVAGYGMDKERFVHAAKRVQRKYCEEGL